MRLTPLSSLSNTEALDAKVREAVNVYDEYVKNKGEPEEGAKPAEGENAEA
jgi:hypothetical protein